MWNKTIFQRLSVATLFGLTVLNVLRGASPAALEAAAVGRRWLGGEILYAQVWSHMSPLVLFMGGLYSRYCTTLVMRIGFEVCVTSLLLAGIYVVRQEIMAQTRYAHVPMGYICVLLSLLIALPGAWSSGIEPLKLSLVLSFVATACAIRWVRSPKTVFAYKQWQHNPRWLVPATLCVALVSFMSPFGAVLAVPSVYICMKAAKNRLVMGGLFAASILAVLWAHLSYFTSYGLMQRWAETAYARYFIYARLTSQPHLSREVIFLLASIAAVIAFASIWALKWRGRVTTRWVYGLSVLVFIVTTQGFPSGFAATILCLMPVFYVPRFVRAISFRLKALLFVALACYAGALSIETWQTSRLRVAQLDIATGYVQQRLGTSTQVLFYGADAGFYAASGFTNPTGLYDLRVLLDNTDSSLADAFRGDMESVRPPFIIQDAAVQVPSRIQEYFIKHYYVVEKTDVYTLMKRKVEN